MKFDYIPGKQTKQLNKRRLALICGLALSVSVGITRLISGGSAAVAGDVPPNPEPIASLAQLPANGAALTSKQLATASKQAIATENFDGIIQTAVDEALAPPKPSEWSTVKIKPKQTLSDVFSALGLSRDELNNVLSLSGDARQLKKLRAGDELHVRISGNQLEGLTYSLDLRKTLEVRRGDAGLEAVTLTADLERREVTAVGVIKDSLFKDGRRAKLSSKQIADFAKLFEYDVDFGQDVRDGDRFAVVYEDLFAKGKKVKGGDILAAEFTNQGKTYRAVRFTAPNGETNYYTPQGQSLRKGFIRSPVDFARISSHFNLSRMHPILHTIRAHKGVDYAAGIGTPIKTTGDGVISFYGQKHGYGNVAMVRHRGGIETLYAHMSRFRKDLSVGSKVRMGQEIGYVGMSGLATAPHLHYEFRIDGVHKDPITVALPRADPVPSRQMARFRNEVAELVAALDGGKTKLAKK